MTGYDWADLVETVRRDLDQRGIARANRYLIDVDAAKRAAADLLTALGVDTQDASCEEAQR
jgi:hypothetical protein